MGLYDSIYLKCPHCGEQEEVQSKAGKCDMEIFDKNSVPVIIAAALQDDDWTCYHCKETFRIKTPYLPATTILIAVK